MKEKARSVALTGVLGALALALSFLEGMLPPLPGTPPGFKLGLSNLVTMFAAGSLGLPAALFLTLLKAGFAALSRGLYGGMMSLCGGLVSTLLVWVLLWRTKITLLPLGICGALAHNAGQLLCSRILTSSAVFFYIPMLLLLGILTGALTGTLLRIVMPALNRLGVRK